MWGASSARSLLVADVLRVEPSASLRLRMSVLPTHRSLGSSSTPRCRLCRSIAHARRSALVRRLFCAGSLHARGCPWHARASTPCNPKVRPPRVFSVRPCTPSCALGLLRTVLAPPTLGRGALALRHPPPTRPRYIQVSMQPPPGCPGPCIRRSSDDGRHGRSGRTSEWAPTQPASVT